MTESTNSKTTQLSSSIGSSRDVEDTRASTRFVDIFYNSGLRAFSNLPYKCHKCEVLCFRTEILLQRHISRCKGKSGNGLGGKTQQMITNIQDDNKQAELFPTTVSQNFQKKCN